jgi:hypothetical protein
MIITIFNAACARCGAAEGPFQLGQSVWFYCAEHKVKWLAAYDLSVADFDRDQERRNFDAIGLAGFEYLGADAEGYYASRPEAARARR